jgi:putative transposase
MDVFEEALYRYGKPEIFNSDQGVHDSSDGFTQTLKGSNIRISMDGQAAWEDNVLVERPWRSVKYKEGYLNAYDPTVEAKQFSSIWIE